MKKTTDEDGCPGSNKRLEGKAVGNEVDISFMGDLRDAIHGFHFANRRLSQLPIQHASCMQLKSLSQCFVHEGHKTCLFVCRGHAQWHSPVEGTVYSIQFKYGLFAHKLKKS